MANVAKWVNDEVLGLTFAVAYLLKLARDKNILTQEEIEATLAAAADALECVPPSSVDPKAAIQPIDALRAMNAGENIIWVLPSQ